MRTFAEIDAEIAEVEKKLELLHEERADAATAKREAIIKAFDDGGTRVEICEAFGVAYHTLGSMLHRSGRNDRQRIRQALSEVERPHYDKLIRRGVPARTARQIAQTVAS